MLTHVYIYTWMSPSVCSLSQGRVTPGQAVPRLRGERSSFREVIKKNLLQHFPRNTLTPLAGTTAEASSRLTPVQERIMDLGGAVPARSCLHLRHSARLYPGGVFFQPGSFRAFSLQDSASCSHSSDASSVSSGIYERQRLNK